MSVCLIDERAFRMYGFAKASLRRIEQAVAMETFTTAQIVSLVIAAAVPALLGGLWIGRRNKRRASGGGALIKRTRQIGTFETRDSRNRLVTLAIYQEYLDAGSKDDPLAERRGRKRIMTMDGRHVDKVGSYKYRIMGTTDILTTDDSNAP
jgi:hypothetical protein